MCLLFTERFTVSCTVLNTLCLYFICELGICNYTLQLYKWANSDPENLRNMPKGALRSAGLGIWTQKGPSQGQGSFPLCVSVSQGLKELSMSKTLLMLIILSCCPYLPLNIQTAGQRRRFILTQDSVVIERSFNDPFYFLYSLPQNNSTQMSWFFLKCSCCS